MDKFITGSQYLGCVIVCTCYREKLRGDYMPTSKKQMVKLNQAKKAKAEELSKQAASGSQEARKKLRKLDKNLK